MVNIRNRFSKQDELGVIIGTLIANKRNEVIELAKQYDKNIDYNSSNEEIIYSVITSISYYKAFTKRIMRLAQESIEINITENINFVGGYDNSGNTTVGTIISGALQGLGMITSTWQSTANINANATIEAAKLSANAIIFNSQNQTQKKLNQTQVFLLIFGAIILLGIVSIVIIKAIR
jgi:hypothetical protein